MFKNNAINNDISDRAITPIEASILRKIPLKGDFLEATRKHINRLLQSPSEDRPVYWHHRDFSNEIVEQIILEYKSVGWKIFKHFQLIEFL